MILLTPVPLSKGPVCAITKDPPGGGRILKNTHIESVAEVDVVKAPLWRPLDAWPEPWKPPSDSETGQGIGEHGIAEVDGMEKSQ